MPPCMDIALTALYLAGKAEETHKKLTPFLQTAFLVLNPTWGGDPSAVRINEEHRIHVTKYERSILLAIDFNFSSEHVHEVAMMLLSTTMIFRDREERQDTLGKAYQFIRETYCRPHVILCYPPSIIAIACLHHISPKCRSAAEILLSLAGKTHRSVIKSNILEIIRAIDSS